MAHMKHTLEWILKTTMLTQIKICIYVYKTSELTRHYFGIIHQMCYACLKHRVAPKNQGLIYFHPNSHLGYKWPVTYFIANKEYKNMWLFKIKSFIWF